jgi:hypothetical protein
MAAHVIQWLRSPERRGRLVERLTTLRNQMARGGACRQAAEIILREARPQTKPTPRPHYIAAPASGDQPRESNEAREPRQAA